MKAFILDVGNSRSKLFLWDSVRQAPAPWPAASEPLNALGSWETPGQDAAWQPWVDVLAGLIPEEPFHPLALTTVVPRAQEVLQGSSLSFTLVGHPGPFPFKVDVEQPETVGSDRYCNLAGATDLGLSSAFIVDVGTATTIDVLEDGVFLGGLILPGPATALRGLIQQTAQLPDVSLVPEPLEAGANTRAAISRGAWNAAAGGIRWCVDGLKARHGDFPVLATGGLARELAPRQWHHEPHLTVRGAGSLLVLRS